MTVSPYGAQNMSSILFICPLRDIAADAIQTKLENLSGNFAVWAASPEATFLHGRFVWANWDVLEMKDIIGPRVKEDEHFLKVGIEGLSEKNGGARF